MEKAGLMLNVSHLKRLIGRLYLSYKTGTHDIELKPLLSELMSIVGVAVPGDSKDYIVEV